MSKEKFSTDVIDGQGKVGDDNDNTVGDQDAESPDDDIEEQSFSTRQGAPSSDWTVKQKREASSMGGKTSSKMRKLAREVERPRCIGHAVRDDLLAAINQFVSQVCDAVDHILLFIYADMMEYEGVEWKATARCCCEDFSRRSDV